MINVSNEFRQLMGKQTDFKENADITFSDGTVIELKEKDFTVSNNNIVDASDTNGIPLGVAICRNIQIELMNDDDRFSDYDFFGATIRLYLTFQLSETVERIEFGTFTVLTPETYGTTIIITALDDMYKSDAEYTTGLVFPATVKSVLVDACDTIDIPLGTTTFLNDDFIVNEKPTDMTFRQLFGYIAMIACGNVRIDRTGRLRIITYDFDAISDIRNNIDGGSFHPWNNPVNLDGGDFTYNIGDVADGGNFTDAVSYHILTNWKELKVDTDDVVITGISQSYIDENDEQKIAMYGSEGYVLNISNPLTVGKEKDVVELIGSLMVGGRFRQFSGDLVSNPTCEFMDTVAIIDRKNNVYFSFITDINFQFFGFTNLKNSAEPTIRNSAKIYSAATETLVSARKLIKKERTARELAVEQLAKDLSNSSGMFMTQEQQPDGSIIYYMHDKKTLSESMIVWKLTALAFGISTDGGKTYPYGFTVNGEAIVNLLYAEGIDVNNLVVGENVSMGPNAKIAWSNVTGTNNVANKSDIPSDEYITKITKNTVTTEYVNALNIKAKSVDAEDITGDLIYGKRFQSNVSNNSWTSIDGSSVVVGNSDSTSDIKMSMIEPGEITVKGSGIIHYISRVKPEIIEIGHTSNNTHISLEYNYIYNRGIISFPSGGEGRINCGSTTLIQLSGNDIIFGYSTGSGKLGFFGNSGSAKKSVTTISSASSATASSNATKINELINALKAYNLIG